MLDQASSDGSRRQAGARDVDQGLHGGGDEGNIGVVACLPVDVLGDDVTEDAPPESEVNVRGTHGSDVIGLKVLRDKALRIGLAHGYGAPKLDPDVADVEIKPLVESDSHTIDVGSGSLTAKQVGRLRDDRLVVWNVRWLAFIVNEDLDFGHSGSSDERGGCVSHG